MSCDTFETVQVWVTPHISCYRYSSEGVLGPIQDVNSAKFEIENITYFHPFPLLHGALFILLKYNLGSSGAMWDVAILNIFAANIRQKCAKLGALYNIDGLPNVALITVFRLEYDAMTYLIIRSNKADQSLPKALHSEHVW